MQFLTAIGISDLDYVVCFHVRGVRNSGDFPGRWPTTWQELAAQLRAASVYPFAKLLNFAI
ncbi:hypothetical protein [Nocardia sp. NPDC056100]|uniref:hypothetical protein n=1 Tax=Nocardia sp. NPDC056100 TaxID=3345712 RepID=UPI0035DCB2C8